MLKIFEYQPEVWDRPLEDSRCDRDYIWVERYDELAAIAGVAPADCCSADGPESFGWPVDCWVDDSVGLDEYYSKCYYSRCYYCYFYYCCCLEERSLHRLLFLGLWYLGESEEIERLVGIDEINGRSWTIMVYE